MNTIQLTVAGQLKTYKGVSSWEEVTSRKQYIRLTRLVYLGELVPAVKFAALRVIYGINPKNVRELFSSRDFSRLNEGSTITVAEYNALTGQRLMDTTNWIWATLPHDQWHFPALRIFHKRFTGPASGLSDMTFGQFIFVDRYYSTIHKDAEHYAEHLKLFVSALFLPKGKPFMMDNISRNATWVKFLKPKTQEAILHNYTGLRNSLVRTFPEIFEADPNAKPDKVLKKSSSGWLDVAMSLAGDDLAKLHTYEENNLWLVMKVIHNAVLRNREMEAIVNKSQKK